MWHPPETQLLTIWQVWHLQINLWGLARKHGHIFLPRQTLMRAKATQLMFSRRVSRRLHWHLFSVSAPVLSLSAPRAMLPFRAGGLICVRVTPRRTVLPGSWERGLDCLSSSPTMFHQSAPSPLGGHVSSLFHTGFSITRIQMQMTVFNMLCVTFYDLLFWFIWSKSMFLLRHSNNKKMSMRHSVPLQLTTVTFHNMKCIIFL